MLNHRCWARVRRGWGAGLAAAWVMGLLGLCGCASRTVSPDERGMSLRPLYGIAAATAEEMAALESILPADAQEARLQSKSGLVYRRVTLDGRNCILFVTGVSVVNAAMNTQLALDRLPITHLLLLGAAGGVNPSREAGDVVVPEAWAHHNEAAYVNPIPGGQGWEAPPGGGTGLPNFGMAFPEAVPVRRLGGGATVTLPVFEADRGLVAAATKVAGDAAADPAGGNLRVIPGGTGVSGPAFVANREYRAWLFQAWRAEVVDLESAAVAQVCWANGIPFVSVRGVVGLAGGGVSRRSTAPDSEPPLVAASRVLVAMLRQLPR